eukprot:735196-Pleurochrysis_carterae.AAC.4
MVQRRAWHRPGELAATLRLVILVKEQDARAERALVAHTLRQPQPLLTDERLLVQVEQQRVGCRSH